MTRTLTTAALILSLIVSTVPVAAADETASDPAPAYAVVPARVTRALARPAVLPALYASYAALQAYDVYSTRQALARGGRELNPLMQGVVGNNSSFVAVKAVAVIGTVILAERLWKTNRPAAIAVMLASNGVAAIVAARNARTLGQLR